MRSDVFTPLVVLIILIAAEARHRTPRNDEVDLASDFDDDDSTRDRVLKHREHRAEQLKNRRRRWQSGYDYDYPAPYYPDYYPPIRNENRQENLIPEILRLLDDIAEYVKRPPPPPPPPQPIYVPYPVPYPVPQACFCRRPTPTPSNAMHPAPEINIPNRFPALDDVRQNWGLVTSHSELQEEDYVDDSVRPVEFTPMSSHQNQSRTVPNISRKFSQSKTSRPTQGFISSRITVVQPEPCDSSILSCCIPSVASRAQATCFSNFGCSEIHGNGNACSRKIIREVLDRYNEIYSNTV